MASPKMDVLRSSLSCGSDGTAFHFFFRFPVSLLGWYALETHLKLYLSFDAVILFPIWILTIHDYVQPPMTHM